MRLNFNHGDDVSVGYIEHHGIPSKEGEWNENMTHLDEYVHTVFDS